MNFLLIDRIYSKTSSTLAIALVWLLYGLPAAFVGLFSGVLIDVWGKKKVLVISNLAQALIILLAIFFKERLYLMYFLVFIYSFVNQFYIPAEGASMPWLVKKRLLASANSLFLLTTQFSFLIGFGTGGLVINLFSDDGTVLLGSLMLFLAAILCLTLPTDISKETYKKVAKRLADNLTKQISISWKYLFDRGKLVLASFAILTLFQTVVVSLGSILPAISKTLLSLSFKKGGPWLILPLSLGLFIGSYIFSQSAKKKRKKYWINIGLFSASTIVLLIVYTPSLVNDLSFRKIFISGLLLLLGISSSLVSVPAQTFIQEATPADLRGRVFGILNSVINFGSVLLVLIIAAFIDIFGVANFLITVGIGGLILSWFTFRRSDEIILAANNRH
jgi:MFS family permease